MFVRQRKNKNVNLHLELLVSRQIFQGSNYGLLFCLMDSLKLLKCSYVVMNVLLLGKAKGKDWDPLGFCLV